MRYLTNRNVIDPIPIVYTDLPIIIRLLQKTILLFYSALFIIRKRGIKPRKEAACQAPMIVILEMTATG